MIALAEMSAAAFQRDGDVLEYNGRWYSWRDLRNVSEQVARLLDDAGIAREAPVTFIARNEPGVIAAFLGLLSQGRTIRMIYPFQSANGIAQDVVRRQTPVLLATARDISDEVKETLCTQGMAAIVLGELNAEALPGFERARPDFVFEPSPEPQIEILTSGTTGMPKKFAVRHAMIADFMIGADAFGPMAPDLSKEAPYLLYFPLGNISGLYTTLPALIKGQRVSVLERFSIDKWLEYVRKYRPVSSGFPPASMQALIDANVPAEDLSSIRAMGFGAAPLDPTLHREFERRYKIPIILSYGATEFGGPVCSMSLELIEKYGDSKFGSVGKPIIGAQLRVIDPETGEEKPPGEEGILEVISPRIGPDWIRTSDLAMIDADGFMFHRGRADGAIMRGGFKLLPETIERALLLHPAISAAGVVAVPDRRLGQVPGAAIVIRPDVERPTEADLEAHLRQHVLATHIPTHWRFVETLPKNHSFKVDRPGLARLFV